MTARGHQPRCAAVPVAKALTVFKIHTPKTRQFAPVVGRAMSPPGSVEWTLARKTRRLAAKGAPATETL